MNESKRKNTDSPLLKGVAGYVKRKNVFSFCVTMILAGGLMVACSVSPKKETTDELSTEAVMVEPNPPAEGFNLSESDAIAMKIADDVMHAMGGRTSWNNARYLYWNFFDARTLLWDKKTGNVRIEFLKQDMNILLNVRSMEGKVKKNGLVLTQQDSISKYLTRGKSIWINDSYWLVMPYKLKDSGVTLEYLREDTTLLGEKSDVLQLTFQEVGDTPDNKYEVWVDQMSNLVTQWAYYPSFNDSLARFTLPWGNYQKYGDILLSDERGERDLKDVKVLESVPSNIFTDFEISLNSDQDGD